MGKERDWVPRVGLALSAIWWVACGNDANAVRAPQATAQVGSIKIEPLSSRYPEQIRLHYPELVIMGLAINSKHAISLSSDAPATIYNLTPWQLDPSVANEVYGFFENLRKADARFGFLVKSNGENRKFVALPRPDLGELTLLVIPDDTPKPEWFMGGDLNFGATQILPDGAAFSFVETEADSFGFFDGSQKMATLGFSIEVCQQMMTVEGDGGRDTSSESSDKNTGQEVFCNSLGYAVASRLLGIPYDEYLKSLGEVVLVEGGLLFYPFPIPPDGYNSIRPRGTIVR